MDHDETTVDGSPPHGAAGGFAAHGVAPDLAEVLAARGIVEPFPVQAAVLPDALAGRDVVVRSRTGSGKTIAFAVPLVERTPVRGRPSTLVLVPTRELATQVADEITALGRGRRLRTSTIVGGVPVPPQVKAARNSDVLVGTPGRVLDLSERRLVRLGEITVVVLDEADRMLDMGFLDEVVALLRSVAEERQTLLFSATLDGAVADLARAFLSDPVRHEVGEGLRLGGTTTHRFAVVEQEAKLDHLTRELERPRDRTLVFVASRPGTERLAKALRARGISAGALHGTMPQPLRERVLARFVDGRPGLLVATDVAARGLDVLGISHVVNFDLPFDERSYVHRVGRTARADRTGDALTLVAPYQRGDAVRILGRLGLEEQLAAAGITTATPTARARARAGSRRPPKKGRARRR